MHKRQRYVQDWRTPFSSLASKYYNIFSPSHATSSSGTKFLGKGPASAKEREKLITLDLVCCVPMWATRKSRHTHNHTRMTLVLAAVTRPARAATMRHVPESSKRPSRRMHGTLVREVCMTSQSSVVQLGRDSLQAHSSFFFFFCLLLLPLQAKPCVAPNCLPW